MAQIDSFLPTGLLGDGEALSGNVGEGDCYAEQPLLTRDDTNASIQKANAVFETNGLLSNSTAVTEEENERKGEESSIGMSQLSGEWLWSIHLATVHLQFNLQSKQTRHRKRQPLSYSTGFCPTVY